MVFPIFTTWLFLWFNQQENQQEMKEKKIPKNRFSKHTLGDNGVTNDFALKLLELKYFKILEDNGINKEKVRFIHAPTFYYDITGDVINPKYEVFIPDNSDSEPSFIGKPDKLITECVLTYEVDDNIYFLQKEVANTKLGIVIFIHEQNKEWGEKDDYNFGIETKQIRIFNLDDI